ncbi:tRNA isopentenyltransferase [Russula compacta]|nr:tRNA isopentenyltransferase [Russula compacta]
MALRPVIAICGTTGVGKSKLAVELALKLSEKFDHHGWKGGVVVNADAMQVYKGFNIITNKIPLGERAGVDHVLMDFKEPTEQYVVGQWIHDATGAINDAHSSKKVPIVVGGTAYWIQHLVFPGRLAVEPEQVSCLGSSPSASSSANSYDGLSSVLAQVTTDLRQLFEALPEVPPSAVDEPSAALALYNLLQALDPAVAARWHWRDTRKVLRNLMIMKESGRKVSEILQEQSTVTLRPRYDTLCLWLYAEPTELRGRLNVRADEMLQNGLLDEVRELTCLILSSSEGNTDNSAISLMNFTFGIFQSIGFREFHRYLTDPSPSELKYQAAIQNLKTANYQYAKRQVSWIRNKLLPAIRASKSTKGLKAIEMYLLDATGQYPQKWTSGVRDVAYNLMEAFLRCDPLPDPLTLSPIAQRMLSIPIKTTDPTAILLARRKIICPICTVDEALPVMIEEGSEWAAHVRTKIHKRLAAKLSKAK